MTRTQTITAFNLTETAKRLGVNRSTVHRAIKSGKLPAHKSGGSTIIYASDLLDYVLSHRGGEAAIEA